MSFKNQWPKMAARNPFSRGEEFEYTGKSSVIHGGQFFEGRWLSGKDKGKTFVTQRGPDGSDPHSDQLQKDWKDQQSQFRKLRSSNPLGAELLIFNPGRKRKMKLRIRRMNKRRRKHSPRRISYRGHRYYFIQLLQKFGKAKAKSIWRSKNKSKARVGTRRSPRKHLTGGSWKQLVKRYGVLGAAKKYSRRR
jgi:hypothetical protein